MKMNNKKICADREHFRSAYKNRLLGFCELLPTSYDIAVYNQGWNCERFKTLYPDMGGIR